MAGKQALRGCGDVGRGRRRRSFGPSRSNVEESCPASAVRELQSVLWSVSVLVFVHIVFTLSDYPFIRREFLLHCMGEVRRVRKGGRSSNGE